MWSDLKFRLSALLRRKTHENNLKDEIEFHLEQQINKHIRAGLPAEEATRLARLEFGAMDLAKEECRDARGLNFLDNAMNDLFYALRLLWKSPGFTLVAVLSLALGTGVNSAVFSVIYGVLLKPLPYPTPSQLVRVTRLDTRSEVTMAEFEFSKQNGAAFASVAAYRPGGERQFHSDKLDRSVRLLLVTTDFLRTLQLQPAFGREFDAIETRKGGPPAVIVSDELWKSAMGADPEAIGRTVRLANDTYTVIGVLPPSFWFHETVDVLLPLQPTGNLSDKGTNTAVIARLKDSVNVRQAQAELDRISGDYRRIVEGQADNDFTGFAATRFHDWLVGDVRLNLMLLFGATGLLLLIACSNIGSLLLTRLAVRRSEFAVRIALGAGTGRLLSQLLIENLLLAGLGGAAGLMSAYAMLNRLISIMPFDLPASAPIRIDGAVLLLTVVVGFATTLLFTIGPFFANRPLDCGDTLQAGGRTVGTGTRRHVRNALVIAEVALSALLLVSAGLLINSLYQLHQEELGFKSHGLLMVETPVAQENRKDVSVFYEFTERVLGSLQRAGIPKVSAINLLPLTGHSNLPTQHFGHQDHSIGGMEIRYVTPSYFELMGIPVKRGRAFTERETAPVAIVSEIVVRRWWPASESLGDRVIIGRFGDRDFNINDSPREVIGVAGDTRSWNVKDPPRPTLYIPIAQIPPALGGPSRMAWVLETTNASSASETARRVLAAHVPPREIGAFRTIDDLVDSNLGNWRFNAWLFGLFAAVALALSAIGIFGLLSYTVAQRRREIGMRIALGASRTDVLKLVLGHGVALVVIGLVLGIAGALFATRSMATLLYRIRPNDPVSYVAVASVLLVVGILASYIPARRATRIDPMKALRV